MGSPNLPPEEVANAAGALLGVVFTNKPLIHAQRHVTRSLKTGAKPCWSAAGQVGDEAEIVDTQRKRNTTGGERPAGDFRRRHHRLKCGVMFFFFFFVLFLSGL